MTKQLHPPGLFLTGTHVLTFFELYEQIDEEHMKTQSVMKKIYQNALIV